MSSVLLELMAPGLKNTWQLQTFLKSYLFLCFSGCVGQPWQKTQASSGFLEECLRSVRWRLRSGRKRNSAAQERQDKQPNFAWYKKIYLLLKLLAFCSDLSFYLWFEFIYFWFPQNQNRTTSGSGFPTHAANCHPQGSSEMRRSHFNKIFTLGMLRSHLMDLGPVQHSEVIQCVNVQLQYKSFYSKYFFQRLWIQLTKKPRRET